MNKYFTNVGGEEANPPFPCANIAIQSMFAGMYTG